MFAMDSARSEGNTESLRSSRRTELPPGNAIRISVSYRGNRHTLNVCPEETVAEIKEIVREVYNIGPDEGPSSAEMQDRKVLSLVYAGSDLGNSWTLPDLGIRTGSTMKAVLRDEVKPSLYVYCVFNGETIHLFDKIHAMKTKVSEFRGIVSRKSGLPVGAFRLLNMVDDGIEMFDARTLDDYDVNPGQTVRMETWDGWNDLLNLSMMGFTSHVMSYLSSNEITSRFQMKVALYIAAHFGHIDLAVSLVKQGIRADEAVGYHPVRQWCKEAVQHIDSSKTPVHESAEAGQLGVLRAFVHQNICNIMAKDGNQLTPLNIALRTKQKACASFLLTKQWNKVNYTKKTSVPLSIYVKMKRWSEQAKEKVLVIHGPWKSSIKNPKRVFQASALLDNGVLLDGYSTSKLMSKPAPLVKMEEEEEARKKRPLFDIAEEDRRMRKTPPPSVYFKTLHLEKTVKLPKVNRHGKMVAKQSQEHKQEGSETNMDEPESESNNESPELRRKYRPRSSSASRADGRDGQVRLPPINEKLGKKSRNVSMSHQTLTTSGTKHDQETERDTGNKYPESVHSHPDDHKATKAPYEIEEDETQSETEQRRKSRSVKSIMKAKARTVGSLALPVSSLDVCPRPFVRGGHVTRETLELYERYRGLKSRDYAIKCMSIGSTFKEKPWLQQVNQAMVISRQGVKKTFDRQPHMFHAESELSLAESARSEVTPSIMSTRQSTTRSSSTTVSAL